MKHVTKTFWVGLMVLGLATASFGNIAYTVSNLTNAPLAYRVTDFAGLMAQSYELYGDGGDATKIILDGATVDVNTLLPSGSGWQLLAAFTVNNVNKQIVGSGVYGGQIVPFIMTPAGDATGNGTIDGADLAVWQTNYYPFYRSGTGFWSGDWNGDGKVNGSDLAIWQGNYSPHGLGYSLEMSEPPTDPVHGPEPTSMVLLALSVGLAAPRIRQAFKRG